MGKRFLAFALSIILCVSLLPASVLAEEGTIAASSEGGSIDPAGEETPFAAGQKKTENDIGSIQLAAAEETAAAMAADDVMTKVDKTDSVNWSRYSFYSVEDDSTVNGKEVFSIPNKGVTLLIFFSTTCWNCMMDFETISETDWIQNEAVHVMALETNGADKEKTDSFLNEHAGTARQYLDAYYGSDCATMMWAYIDQFYLSDTVTWPVLVLLTEQNGAPVIRYASTGYQDISEITAHVEELVEVVASGSCGENLTWTLDEAGTLTISGTGDMWDYSSLDVTFKDRDWNKYCDSIKTVVIREGVTRIGGDAFSYCASLTSVNIPDSVTSIGDNAFLECGSLAEISIPDSVTSVGEYVFFNCVSLTDVVLPNSLAAIGPDMFEYCESLVSIRIPDSVTNIGELAFNGCGAL